MKKSIILILSMVLVMIMGSFAYVSAQDVDNMSNEQLTTLLLQIMQKLEQSEETPETPEPTPTAKPVPTEIPELKLSDDKAELDALLMAIMQKLQLGENTGTAPQKPAGTMVPVSDEPENDIWENKKLIIEGLPSYMFIQPTKEEPNHGQGTQSEVVTEHYYGEPCSRPDVTDRDCFWADWDGTWACKCPRG